MKGNIRKTLYEYKAKLMTAQDSELPAIRMAFSDWYYSVSEQDRNEMQPFWREVKDEAWKAIHEIKEALNELRVMKEAEPAEAKK